MAVNRNYWNGDGIMSRVSSQNSVCVYVCDVDANALEWMEFLFSDAS